MKSNRFLLTLLSLVLLCTSNLSYSAQNCEDLDNNLKDKEQPYSEGVLTDAIYELNENGSCYPELNGDAPWLKDFKEKSRSSSLAQAISNSLPILLAQIPRTPIINELDGLRVKLNQMRLAIDPTNGNINPNQFKADDFKFTVGAPPNKYGKSTQFVTLQKLAKYCSSTVKQKECLAEVKLFHYVFYAMSTLASRVNQPQLNNELQRYNVLNTRWDSYFDSEDPQNILELLINKKVAKLISKKSCESNDDHCANYGGSFQYGPPNYRIRTLNPSVAFEYIDDAEDGDQFKESLIIELLGFDRWSWQEHKKKNPWGVSLIAAYSDRENIDDLGFGVNFRLGSNISVGITSHGNGNEGFFLSIDLQKYITSWEDKKETFVNYKDILNVQK